MGFRSEMHAVGKDRSRIDLYCRLVYHSFKMLLMLDTRLVRRGTTGG